MQQQTVILKKEQHREQNVLSLYMPKDTELNSIAKKLGARYSATKRMWWLPWGKFVTHTAYTALKEKAWVDYSALKTYTKKPPTSTNKPAPRKKVQKDDLKSFAWTVEQKDAMWAYSDKLTIRRYSKSAFTTYGYYFKQFLAAHPTAHPKDITEEQIIAHVIRIVKNRSYSAKTQNQIINAIKFYYEKVLGLKKKEYWLPRPRKEFKLPTVASEEEVVRILVAAGNLKHQCIIGMFYSTGARREELLNMRVADVDMDRMQVAIRAGKGKKDRITLLSQRMAVALEKYLNEYNPHYWLFEGVERKKYSGTSITKVVRDARIAAGIKKKITPHVLRHSFATHLMDNGTDTRYIQELLGHKSLETTAIYAHVSTKDFQKIISPLDRIFENNKLNNKKLKE